MTVSQSHSGPDQRFESVLTLAEAAVYLRGPERDLAELAETNDLPARKVAGEWRFLRRGLDDWLGSSGRHPQDVWMSDPQFLMDSLFVDTLLRLLEDRLLRKLQQASPSPPWHEPGGVEAFRDH